MRHSGLPANGGQHWCCLPLGHASRLSVKSIAGLAVGVDRDLVAMSMLRHATKKWTKDLAQLGPPTG